jgi:hypothetical protein
MAPEERNAGAVPVEYVVGRLQEALASDPRVAELTLEVRVLGDVIYVSGSVPTRERRSAVHEIALRECPGFVVRNDVSITEVSEAPDPEELQ